MIPIAFPGLKAAPYRKLKKLETGLRTISAGIPCALKIEAIEFPTFGLLLQVPNHRNFEISGFRGYGLGLWGLRMQGPWIRTVGV